MRRLRVADVAADVADGLVDVAVGDDEIERAVEIDVGEDAAESERVARRRADAGLRPPRRRYSPRPSGAIQADHLVVEVGDRQARHAGVVEVGRVDAHARARLAVGAECDARPRRATSLNVPFRWLR